MFSRYMSLLRQTGEWAHMKYVFPVGHVTSVERDGHELELLNETFRQYTQLDDYDFVTHNDYCIVIPGYHEEEKMPLLYQQLTLSLCMSSRQNNRALGRPA